MGTQTKERIIDWNHVYLLGWYGPDGHPHFTTWMGDLVEVRVVVTGPEVEKWGPPIWKAPANCKPNDYGFPSYPFGQFQLHEVKENEDWEAKARELGGIRAFGWYIERGFERKWD